MRATTDSGPTVPNQPKNEAIENIFSLMELCSSEDVKQFYNESYNNCSIRYGDMKKQIAEDMIALVKPLSEKIDYFQHHPKLLQEVLEKGGEKARASASKTLRDVREIIGLKYS